MKETILVDYDGTIELAKGKPNQFLIDWLNKQKNKRIIIWTSRDWLYYDYIEFQLEQFKVEYDVIYCGKPLADIYIDDRAIKWEDL